MWQPPASNFLGENRQLRSLTLGGLDLSREADCVRFDAALFTWASLFRRDDQEPTLHTLRLQSCKFSSGVIARIFGSLPQLEVLELTSTPDSELTRDSVGIIFLALKDCKQLRELHLSVPISRKGSMLHPPHQVLSDGLLQWPHLRLLLLPTLPRKTEGVLNVWNTLGLGLNPQLEVLHMPGVDSTEGAAALKSAVKDHLPLLTHLSIRPSSAISTEEAKELQEFLETRSEDADFVV